MSQSHLALDSPRATTKEEGRLSSEWDKLVQNGANVGLFKTSFSAFWINKAKSNEIILFFSPIFVQFRANQGLLKIIIFSTFWIGEPKYTENYILKKAPFALYWANQGLFRSFFSTILLNEHHISKAFSFAEGT